MVSRKRYPHNPGADDQIQLERQPLHPPNLANADDRETTSNDLRPSVPHSLTIPSQSPSTERSGENFGEEGARTKRCTMMEEFGENAVREFECDRESTI